MALASHAGWSLFAYIASNTIGLLLFAIAARILSISELGMVTASVLAIKFCENVATLGFPEYLVFAKRVSRQRFLGILRTVVVVGAVLFLSVSFGASFLVSSGLPTTERLVCAVAVTLAISPISLCYQSIYRRELRTKELAVAELLSRLTTAALVVSLLLSGIGPIALAIQMPINHLVMMIVLALGTRRLGFDDVSDGVSENALRFGIPVTGTKTLGFLGLEGVQLIVGGSLGSASLALLSASQRVLSLGNQAVSVVSNQVLFPILSKTVSVEEKAVRYRAVADGAFRVSTPFFFGLSLYSDCVVHVVLGVDWSEAAALLSVMALIGVASTQQRVIDAVLNSTGKTKARLAIQFLNTVANVLVVFAFLEQGLFWVVTATTARVFVLFPVSLLFLGQVLSPYASRLFPISHTALLANFPLAVASLVNLASADIGEHPVFTVLSSLAICIACTGWVRVWRNRREY